MSERPQETGSVGPEAGRAPLPAAARLLGFAAAVSYPAYWLAQFAFGSLLALLRVMGSGEEIKIVRVTALGSFLLSGAPGDPPERLGYPGRFVGGQTPLAILVVVALAALVFHFTRRRGALPGGLFLAMLGYVGFEQLLRRLWVESPGAAWIAEAVLFAGLWTLGLRRVILASARTGAGFGWRFAAALVAFTVPLGGLWLALGWLAGMRVLRPFVWLFIPGLLPAALAAYAPIPGPRPVPAPIAWKAIAAAGAAAVALAATLVWAGPKIEHASVRRQAERARAMVASLPEVSPTAPYPRQFFQRGVNFTAEFGAPYASADALEELNRLPRYGVNSVALVVYGWTDPDRAQVRIGSGLNIWESDEGVEDLARMAHSLGMKVFLKPQLWTRGRSAAQLAFRDPAARERWFGEYAQFLDHYARLATRIHADLFAVGVELAQLSPYEADWRRLIAAVRQVYPGPLVYAANFGRDFQQVRFWDALDYVGLDEYYPLPDDLSTAALLRRVERVAVEYRRPVLFTEVGFPSLVDPGREPWNDSPRAVSLRDQARCYQAIFQAFYTKPWFSGLYWWKVGTNGAGGPADGSFTPLNKPAMEVVERWYESGDR